MGTNKKQILHEHTQRFIRETMADRLRNEGFKSKDGQDIHWYRLVNGEVLHTVYFYTQSTALPAFLEIGFGLHPLFLTPEFPTSPYMRDLPGNEILYPRWVLLKQANKVYSYDAMITCPDDQFCGADILEKIFPVLDEATSSLQCYQIHKQWREAAIKNDVWVDMTAHFVDEAIFWDDHEIYPYCLKFISARTKLLEKALEKHPKSKRFRSELDYLNFLQLVLDKGLRDDHLQLMKKREQETIRMLERHVWFSRK